MIQRFQVGIDIHLLYLVTHMILPRIVRRRPFGDENKVCASTLLMLVLITDDRIVHANLSPASRASQPQWRPITSTTKARECENAVELILSMASQIRCRAVGAPMVRSVMDMSLSIEPTRPTMRRCACRLCSSSEIKPDKSISRLAIQLAFFDAVYVP